MNKNDPELSRAVKYLKKALPEMTLRNIPTTPENYAVWYEYTLGHNAALIERINELDADKTIYTPEVNHRLYHEFVVARSAEADANKIKNNVRTVINRLLADLAQEDNALSEYSRTLDNFCDDLRAVEDPDDLKEMVRKVLIATHQREESTRLLQSAVHMMAEDMDEIRNELTRVSEEVNTDYLTRLANRRYFDITLERSMAAAHESNSELSLVTLDIDNFKSINDTYGHNVGDKVLRYVASLLRRCVRGGDTVARLGGEEFCLLLPETDYTGAKAVAEKVRQKMAGQPLSDKKENLKIGHVTLSAGVASYDRLETPEEFLRRADYYLYHSKKNGRNLVSGERDTGINEDDTEYFGRI